MNAIEPSELVFTLRLADANAVTQMKEKIEAFYGCKVSTFDVIVADVSARLLSSVTNEMVIDFALVICHRHLNWDTTKRLIKMRLREFATALDVIIQF